MAAERTLRFGGEDGTLASVTLVTEGDLQATVGAIEDSMARRGLYPLDGKGLPRARFMPYWACAAIGLGIPVAAVGGMYLLSASGGGPHVDPGGLKVLAYLVIPVFGVLCTAYFYALERQVRGHHARVVRVLERHGVADAT